MAKNKYLDLTVRIAGKLDKSLMSTINGTRNNLANMAQTISRIGTAGLTAMGTMGAATVKILADCTSEAVKYQNALGDVIKYVDGLADASGKIGSNEIFGGNGKTYAENYETVYDAILDIATVVPMTKEELAELTALMGQSGKTIEQMFTFDDKGNVTGGLIKDAAVMAAAWDIGAQEAADYGAKWENSFRMTHEEVMTLANQINYLGANSATTAREIAGAVNQAASLGQLAGIDPATVAALADAMLATGVGADRVGTSIKRMALNLSKGQDMTKKQRAVLAEMGLTADQVAKGMQEDSVGMLNKLFAGIKNLPKERQLNAVGQLFGIWAAEGGAKIVNNLDVYQKALEMVADEQAYMNSMQREFDIKTATPEAIRQMRDSAIEMFQVGIGKEFLPAQAQMDEAIRQLFLQLNDNMPQLKELAGTLADLASKGIEKVGEVIQTALPHVQKFLDYVNNNGPQVAKILGGLVGVFTGMKFAPGITGLLGGAGKLLFGGTGGAKAGSGGKSGGLLGNVFKGGQSFFGKAGSYISTGAASVAENGIGTSLLAAKNTLFNVVGNSKVAQGVKGVGGYFGGIGASIGKLGGAILNPASASAPITLGSTGPMAAIGGLLGNVKNVAGAGVFSSVLGPIASGFGGLLSGALPVVGIISSIIAVVSILNDKFDILGKIFNAIFGEEGPQKLESFKTTLDNVFNGDGLIQALAPVRDAITGMFGENAGAAFGGLAQILQSIMGVVGQVVTFAQTTVKPIIQDIFNFITTTVVPVLLQTFTAAAPYISGIITNLGTAIMTVAQYIGQAIQAAMPYIQAIISTVLSIGSVVIPALLAAFEGLTGMLQPIIDNIKQVLDGIIQAVQGILDFVIGVFTGDWDKAWQGVRDIFGGIWSALEGLVKAPINAIIGIINGAISGINAISFTMPDWSPIMPGQKIGFNIPTIPYLAKGGFTTGPSIAGEAGTEAVISFQRSARAQNIDIWRQAGRMLGMNRLAEVPTVPAAPAGGGFEISFSPHIEIRGNADRAVVDQALEESEYRFQAWLEANFDQLYDRMTRERGRRAYA